MLKVRYNLSVIQSEVKL